MYQAIIAFPHRAEDFFIGDVQKALSPLLKIKADLERVQTKALTAEAIAREEVTRAAARAEEHVAKAPHASDVIAKLTAVIG